MKQIANFNGFFYFERKLLEDYLNDMAKEGYHLKMNTLRHKFEFLPDKHCYYHVDAIKTKKRYFGQNKPDEDYIELFESQGYHFIGNVNYFNIFESKHKESIFGDEDENEVVKNMFSKEFKYVYYEIFMQVLYLFLISLILGTIDIFHYTELSDGTLFLMIFIALNILSRIIYIEIPLVRYRIKKQIIYDYNHVFKRVFIYSMITLLQLFLCLGTIIVVDLEVLIIGCLCIIGIMIFSLFSYKNNHYLQKNTNISLVIGIIVLVAFNNLNNAFVLEHPFIKMKGYSQRSSLLEWAWYDLKDSGDALCLVDVYEPILNNMVLNDFIEDRDYVQEGNAYIFDDYVVVQKGNRFLRMSKDFYENKLVDLEW